jgi:hypothetical protein
MYTDIYSRTAVREYYLLLKYLEVHLFFREVVPLQVLNVPMNKTKSWTLKVLAFDEKSTFDFLALFSHEKN